MGGMAKGLGVMGALALGCVAPREAVAAGETEGTESGATRICPETAGEGVVVCFGDGGLGPDERGVVEAEVRALLDGELASEGLRISGAQQLLVRVDGIQPNLVFHVEPVGEDGKTLAGWERTYSECDSNVGCTTDDWRRVVCEAMRQALVDLRSPDGAETDPDGRRVDPGPSSEPLPYRPSSLGLAGVVTASVGGLGLLTGAGLIIVGSLPDNPAPGLRQDRDLLPLSRDFYTPGAVTMGVSAAVAAAGIAMVVVDLRRWRARQGSATTSGQRTRLQLTASPWGRGVRVGGRF